MKFLRCEFKHCLSKSSIEDLEFIFTSIFGRGFPCPLRLAYSLRQTEICYFHFYFYFLFCSVNFIDGVSRNQQSNILYDFVSSCCNLVASFSQVKKMFFLYSLLYILDLYLLFYKLLKFDIYLRYLVIILKTV